MEEIKQECCEKGGEQCVAWVNGGGRGSSGSVCVGAGGTLAQLVEVQQVRRMERMQRDIQIGRGGGGGGGGLGVDVSGGGARGGSGGSGSEQLHSPHSNYGGKGPYVPPALSTPKGAATTNGKGSSPKGGKRRGREEKGSTPERRVRFRGGGRDKARDDNDDDGDEDVDPWNLS